ncbi:hypothetical protein T03_1198 [Trichinella britovi]|uniref:Uncharacterized protein n=1 Tax=Trichinella britovi TaxID=45882 RepID=A0A0V1CTB9_TRIBR|nr:hypothetical protein T03_1198 [Trichinella britovi]
MQLREIYYSKLRVNQNTRAKRLAQMYNISVLTAGHKFKWLMNVLHKPLTIKLSPSYRRSCGT